MKFSPVSNFGDQSLVFLDQKFQNFNFTHKINKKIVVNMDIQEKKSDPNSQFLTHWPLLGNLNGLENDCTKNLFIHFGRNIR